MKTAIIWNEIEEIKYAVVDGDQTRFQGVYINNCEDEALSSALNDLIYDDEGHYKIGFCPLADFGNAIVEGALLVECGFVP